MIAWLKKFPTWFQGLDYSEQLLTIMGMLFVIPLFIVIWLSIFGFDIGCN